MTLNLTDGVPAWLRETPIAHRGLHALPHIPENSLAAFVVAADAGFAIELDVRLLRSGEVVVFHDADWFRMTGHTGIVEESTAFEIVSFRLLQTSEPVPFLADVLQTVAGRVPFLIELKSGTAPVGQLEDAVLQIVAGYGGAFALQSFRKETVAYLRARAPESVACGQLAASDDWYSTNNPENLPDFLGYAAPVLPTPLTTAFRENNGPVLAWTVRTAAQQEQVAAFADNIIFENFNPK